MEHITDSELGKWLFCAACALIIANQALKFLKSFRGKMPTPPNESLDAAHVALKERVMALEDKFRALEAATQAEDKRILKELSDFIAMIERAIGRLEGAIKSRGYAVD